MTDNEKEWAALIKKLERLTGCRVSGYDPGVLLRSPNDYTSVSIPRWFAEIISKLRRPAAKKRRMSLAERQNTFVYCKNTYKFVATRGLPRAARCSQCAFEKPRKGIPAYARGLTVPCAAAPCNGIQRYDHRDGYYVLSKPGKAKKK